jgi:thiamine biosynthesis lipoprotein
MLLAALTGCTRTPEALQLHGETMGTTYNISVGARPRGVSPADLQDVVDEILDSIDTHLSTYAADSEITALNSHAANDWFEISQPLYEVLSAAQRVSRETGGAFDVTVGPLVRLWGFGESYDPDAGAPADQDIEAALATVGNERLELRSAPRSARKLAAGLRVNVGAIAPGYAVDLIAGRFRAMGASNYLIEIGGEVLAGGASPAGRAWRVAIEAPLPAERRPYAIIELDDVGVSTSGDYRDFRVLDDQRISHTIDPRTGRPVTHRLTSVTVVHASAMLADAYATALMVLGPVAGLEMAERLDLAALFIERGASAGDFTEHATAGFDTFRRPLP